MNMISRGARNAFRNYLRTGSIVIILGISIGLALSMLVAREAVTTKIETVKSSVGNTVTVAPAGARGFEGGENRSRPSKQRNLPASTMSQVPCNLSATDSLQTTQTSSLA